MKVLEPGVARGIAGPSGGAREQLLRAHRGVGAPRLSSLKKCALCSEEPAPARQYRSRHLHHRNGPRAFRSSTIRSSSRTRFCSSGSFAKTALDLSHARFSMAG